MTVIENLTEIAERRGIPLRTLDNVRDALAHAKRSGSDREMASMMLRFGRLTPEARAYVAREYPS